MMKAMSLSLFLAIEIFSNDSIIVNLPGNVPLVMIQISGSTFIMGNQEPAGSPWNTCEYTYSTCDKPQHNANVSPFYIGKYELTQRQWVAVMGNNPAFFKGVGLDGPVEQVSWTDCQAFCDSANKIISRPFRLRLPTESEWEYTCRAGATTRFFFGDGDCSPDTARDCELSQYAWWSFSGTGSTHLPGLLKPNAWGLYDMLGNVYEWVADAWNINYNGAPADGAAWMTGDTLSRVTRGSWQGTSGVKADARFYTSYFRTSHPIGTRHGCCGVRLAMNSPTTRAELFRKTEWFERRQAGVIPIYRNGRLMILRGKEIFNHKGETVK